MKRPRPGLAKLSHRVQFCTAADVGVVNGAMVLNRVEAFAMWAHIEAERGSYFARDGFVIEETHDKPSHRITTRYRPDILIANTAWLYEARLLSPPRWFKILEVQDLHEDGRYWYFKTRLVDQSDLTAPPETAAKAATLAAGASPLPPGVLL